MCADSFRVCPNVERYEEQLLALNRGNLRIRLRFSDGSLLEISEAIVANGNLRWLSYHYQDSSAGLVFRYDNAPHHRSLSTYPENKHTTDRDLPSYRPSIQQVFQEVEAFHYREKGKS